MHSAIQTSKMHTGIPSCPPQANWQFKTSESIPDDHSAPLDKRAHHTLIFIPSKALKRAIPTKESIPPNPIHDIHPSQPAKDQTVPKCHSIPRKPSNPGMEKEQHFSSSHPQKIPQPSNRQIIVSYNQPNFRSAADNKLPRIYNSSRIISNNRSIIISSIHIS
ncbi:hypothetical protein Nepgr_024693 [Nepenthes gracilis]|uniref:Uncharacterized protein n=1 Tax=Nepenthes gracilis TaxID=150966 RepID=A0AAD3T3R1_NEPGR|nr:hypothetical protein Nepgr_024693 [Nepenthes gracilis]